MTRHEWCISQHEKTKHFYDEYLPYEFHLRMVVRVAYDFKHLLPNNHNILVDVINAAWGHDLIEDARCSYNDVKKHMGERAADIVYALTNEKGKTRKDRANEKYYEGIRNTPYAAFVKLCDRIANVQYSKMTNSQMFKVYEEENENFEKMLGRYTQNKDLNPMFTYLETLFKN